MEILLISLYVLGLLAVFWTLISMGYISKGGGLLNKLKRKKEPKKHTMDEKSIHHISYDLEAARRKVENRISELRETQEKLEDYIGESRTKKLEELKHKLRKYKGLENTAWRNYHELKRQTKPEIYQQMQAEGRDRYTTEENEKIHENTLVSDSLGAARKLLGKRFDLERKIEGLEEGKDIPELKGELKENEIHLKYALKELDEAAQHYLAMDDYKIEESHRIEAFIADLEKNVVITTETLSSLSIEEQQRIDKIIKQEGLDSLKKLLEKRSAETAPDYLHK